MISEDNNITFAKLVDYNKSKNIPFEIKNFEAGGRPVEALQRFEADLPIDGNMEEKEEDLREFLRSDIKFLK